MNASHTPGPWFYLSRDEWSHSVATNHGLLPSGEPSYWTVAEINKRREPEHVANARLIAAAPDLLEALKGILEVHGVRQDSADIGLVNQSWVDISDLARAAIAKATGAQA